MTREVSISEDDIKAMEQEVATKRSGMSSEEANFVDYLLKRAKGGQQTAAASPGVAWTWTYRF